MVSWQSLTRAEKARCVLGLVYCVLLASAAIPFIANTVLIRGVQHLCRGLLAFSIVSGICASVCFVFAIALAATLSSSGGADRKGEEDNDEADDGEGAFLDHDYQAHASAPKRKGGDYGYGAVGLDESAADPDSTPLAGSGVPRSSPQRKGACARLCSGRCGCLLRWVGIVFSLVVVGALWTSFGFIVSVHLRSLPRIDGELRLPGLIGRVTVTREHANTIHIFAERTDDLYFAQGVVAAQERLWQLEFQRRVVTGTLASKVGEAAIETDELMRTLGLYRDAAALFPLLSPAASAALTAYTNGVNTYIAEVKPRPFEFFLLGYHPEPFEPAELLAWGKVLSLDLSLNMMDELQRFQWLTERNMTCERIAELMQPYDTSRFPTVLSSLDVTYPPSNSSSGNHSCANEPVVQWLAQQRALGRWPRAAPLHPGFAKLRSLLGPSFFAARASNNWVVHGSRTASGKPLLANDPHLQLMAPSIWMVVHLQVGNSSITGASLPGLPSIVIGYNDHLAWGITNVGADVQDLYIMEEPEGNSSVYLLNGQWTPYAVREEVIDVKGSHARVLQVRKSVFGPVITGVFRDAYKGQVPLSLQWTTLSSNDTTVESFFLFSTATSYSEFRQAQRFFLAPVSNVVYADVDGNIAYTMAGQVPRRIANHSGLFPVPGSTSTYAWRSMIEFEYMPVSLNPPEGFLVTANNQVTPPDWPDDYRIALDWDSGSTGYRALRITQLLQSRTNLTMDDMRAIQHDVKSLLFSDFASVVATLPPAQLSRDAAQWQSQLLSWDGQSTVGSTEASVFNTFMAGLASLTNSETLEYTRDFRFLLSVFNGSVTEPDCGSSCQQFAVEQFNKAVATAKRERWGQSGLHQALFQHLVLGESPLACLANRCVDKAGDQETINVGPFAFNETDFRVLHGSSYRQIVNMAQLNMSLYVNPPGQSGNTLSVSYDDQLHAWVEGGYLPLAFDVLAPEHHLLLLP